MRPCARRACHQPATRDFAGFATTWVQQETIQRSVPGQERPLPVSSSTAPQFPEAQTRLFREVLELLNASAIPYVVSGAFALHAHTGIWRDTKDLDLFL